MTDWGQGKTISDPLEGNAVTKWADLLMGIMEALARLESGLVAIKLEQARLEAAGMYRAVPSESWEARNGGEARYLRMVFPMGTLENGGRKLYVGAHPRRIEKARSMATRRERWERLETERGWVEWVLQSKGVALHDLARDLADRRVAEELGLEVPTLGTEGAPPGGDSVTKEPGLLCPSCGFDLGKLAMGQVSLGQLKQHAEWLRTRPEVEYHVREGEDE